MPSAPFHTSIVGSLQIKNSPKSNGAPDQPYPNSAEHYTFSNPESQPPKPFYGQVWLGIHSDKLFVFTENKKWYAASDIKKRYDMPIIEYLDSLKTRGIYGDKP